MQVEKILIIESPVRLFKIMDSKNEIFDLASSPVYHRLMGFCDRVRLFLNGCKCDEEENYSEMMREYSNIQNDSESISHLSSCIGCDRIEFK
jgi:hypothetical protein